MYNLSKDYEELWNLVQAGETIICFVNYSTTNRRDVCKCVKLLEGEVEFTARNYGYANILYGHIDAPQYETFLSQCRRMNVEWITSNIKEQA